ncbi:MAG: FAD-dependent oxidoreductase [bacterium]
MTSGGRPIDRRAAIRGIAAGLGALAVACSEDEAPGVEYDGPSVAVIGAGVAGVTAAWLLDETWRVDLYEANDRLGGNVHTIDVEVGGRVVPIDMGAQYYHPRVYPGYARLIDHLGLGALDATDGSGATEVPGTISMTRTDGSALFVSPRIPDRVWPLGEVWNADPINAFRRYAEAGRAYELSDPDWLVTVDEWLPTIGLDPAMRDGLILPLLAALNSGHIEETRGFSARSAMIFMTRALGEGALEAVSYFTLDRALVEVLRRMLAETSTVTTHLGRAATRIERGASGERPIVVDPTGRRVAYDAVVLTGRPDVMARVLADDPAAGSVRPLLGQVDLHDARIALHRDPAYAHADPMYRSFLNAIPAGASCEASMQLALALRPVDGQPVELWKSWITHREPPREPVATVDFRHVLYTPSTHRAGVGLAARQGEGGLYFAGGWTSTHDVQETALMSAVTVADLLAPGSARLALLRGEG